MPTDFQKALSQYRATMTRAIDERLSHDYRRQQFITLLGDGLGVPEEQIGIEDAVRQRDDATGRLHVRGYVDAQFGDVLFEFKKSLPAEREEGIREITTYFSGQPHSRVAVMTDGKSFEVFARGKEGPLSVRTFDIFEASVPHLHVFFDSLLLTQRTVPATADHISNRFGPSGRIYNEYIATLGQLWDVAKASPSGAIKFQQWKRMLCFAYANGTDRVNERLFLDHTYLILLTKTIARVSLFNDVPLARADLLQVLTGEFFTGQGWSNIAENDFFCWLCEPATSAAAIGMIDSLVSQLERLEWTDVDEDLFRNLYQQLVDRETRHALGEFYTPTWYAELALKSAGFAEALACAIEEGTELPRIADPACGSGTFIFCIITAAKRAGLRGSQLAEYCLNSIVGMDVHPLAVAVSRVNWLLAVGDAAKSTSGDVVIPVYLANSLFVAEHKGSVPEINIHADNTCCNIKHFDLPVVEAIDRQSLHACIEAMHDAAKSTLSERARKERFNSELDRLGVPDTAKSSWIRNLRLLHSLISNDQNGIWAYILKNLSAPALLQHAKMNFIVGNPPWMALNRIGDAEYKEFIKSYAVKFGLIGSGETHLHTQIELATVFFVLCARFYLAERGTIAFVMPKSVISPARQHRAFRHLQFRRIVDCEKVAVPQEPAGTLGGVFGIPSVILVADGDGCVPQFDPRPQTVTDVYEGTLPSRDLKLSAAAAALATTEAVYEPQAAPDGTGFYHDKFEQGANISPRAFWFVERLSTGKRSRLSKDVVSVRTRPKLKTQPQFAGISVSGSVETRFIFATALSEGLLPFAMRFLWPVVLPASQSPPRIFKERDLTGSDTRHLRSWLHKLAPIWDSKKPSSGTSEVTAYVNYRNKLSKQLGQERYIVLYPKSGTNLAACVLDEDDVRSADCAGLSVKGFVSESVMYWYRTAVRDEAHYLCAILNSSVVNEAIKQHQSRGAFGERDIHLLPVKVLPIPKYDASKADHRKLAKASLFLHALVAKRGPTLRIKSLGRLRSEIRRRISRSIKLIDGLVLSVTSNPAAAIPDATTGGDPKLF
jgi:hypothetical protein